MSMRHVSSNVRGANLLFKLDEGSSSAARSWFSLRKRKQLCRFSADGGAPSLASKYSRGVVFAANLRFAEPT